MTSFRTSDTFKRVRDLINTSDDAILAVSYWGSGATKRLGLDGTNRRRRITIICDLESGACNPKELKTLKRLGYSLFTVTRFHAKVYWTSKGAIVGSSNASANGLGDEGDILPLNLEANWEIRDTKNLKQIRRWIDNVVLSKAKPITMLMINNVIPIWNQRQRSRPLQQQPLSEYLKQPDLLKGRDWWIYLYSDPKFTGAGQKIYENNKAKDGRLDGWEFGEKKGTPGRLAIDYLWSNGELLFKGIWEHYPLAPRASEDGYYFHTAIRRRGFETVKVDAAAKRQISQYLRRRIGRTRYPDFSIKLDEVARSLTVI